MPKSLTVLSVLMIATFALSGCVVTTSTPPAATVAQVSGLTAENTRRYLTCGDGVNEAQQIASRLTLAQLANPALTVAAVNRAGNGLDPSCIAVSVRQGGLERGFAYVRTRDGWTVKVVAYMQPNGFDIVFIDPVGAFIGRQPNFF